MLGHSDAPTCKTTLARQVGSGRQACMMNSFGLPWENKFVSVIVQVFAKDGSIYRYTMHLKAGHDNIEEN